MAFMRRRVRIETERMTLRPPVQSDYAGWAGLRKSSVGFLQPWEPSWSEDHLSRRAFSNRVYWAARALSSGTA
ncbi:30S ribosomal protein S5 alanine N-acetyltransferase, partial [Thioclava sp. BHET1]